MKEYVSQIWRCRHFWLSLVKMDLRSRYRRSLLGIGWSLLYPICMSTILCMMFYKLFDVPIKEFAPFLLSGVTLWNFFSGSLTMGCECFFGGETYIRQHPAPLAIYPLRTVLGLAIHFGLALVLVLVATWGFQGFGNLSALPWLVPALLLLMILGWSLAVLAGFANVLFPDVKHLLDVGLQILYFATPIMIPLQLLEARGMTWIVNYNPVSAVIATFRDPILKGQASETGTYLVVGMFVFVAAAAATATLARLQRRLIFYL